LHSSRYSSSVNAFSSAYPAHLDLLVNFHPRICEGTWFQTLFWLVRHRVSQTGCVTALAWPSVSWVRKPHAIERCWRLVQFVQSLELVKGICFSGLGGWHANATWIITHSRVTHPSIAIGIRPTPACFAPFARSHTWQSQLHQNGHFDHCLEIAGITVTFGRPALFDEHGVLVTDPFFSIIDASARDALLQEYAIFMAHIFQSLIYQGGITCSFLPYRRIRLATYSASMEGHVPL
jgi:hypothetical protein